MAETRYIRISPGDVLPSLSTLAPFKAVVALETSYSSDWQAEVSAWLVAEGCRYMMAWGPGCSSWDDSVDFADLEARNYEDDDSRFVMTTWHEDESLESVFWFSQFCGNFSYDDQALENTVIVHVSEVDRTSEYLALYRSSETLAEREPD